MEIAIRTGRRHANDEQFAQAVEVWKEALGAAYSQQDFASLFVLSKNVGEVCRRLASQSKEPLSLLQEALEHFDYALGVINECSLRNVLGSYKALYCSVRRVEMERGRVMKQIREIQDGEAHLQKEKGAIECATCGIGSGEMVLDENDGCYYCRTCYEEYYAAERETEDELPCKDRIESWQKTEGPDNSGDDEETMRTTYQEHRANCSNESAMEELAAALFDSKESPPFSTQARILSDGWCKDGLLQ
ncbi:hypothetical protein PHYBOEH_011039 [Phytophthora boehmeriae]|uniref:Uncharacterized protein n=1 Tax=Phytophthora boehmeriae TaxID=109152 RepID=A0A8T1XEF9_9STRA|nr:hypothetical protein PHYBOEH_011039 [Phytophthora boehmeriae]